MQRKESRNPANQSRLLSVIILLIATFAIWFGLLLSNAQKDLNYAAERITTDKLVIPRGYRTWGLLHASNSWIAQVLFVSWANLMSWTK
jgi:cytochrome c-type biogenesis protein CcmE